MNPNDPYFHQQPPMSYAQGYSGMQAPPRTPVMPPQQQQQFPPGPPMGQYGLSPRPQTTPFQSPMPGPPGPPNPNQLAQQMGGMNLGDGASKSPSQFPPMGPPMGPPMNGNASPAPNTFPPRPQTSFQPGPMPPQQPPRPGLAPPQMPMGMSPQQPFASPGAPPMNGQMSSPRPPMAPGYPQPSYPGQPAFQQPQQPTQASFDSMSNRYPPGPAGFAPPGPAAPQQARRLDPEQMPSAIQVMEDDRKNHSGPFETSVRGAMPPLVTTPFVTVDRGNAGPRFIRSTMYSVPVIPDTMKQTAVPFGIVVTPFAKTEEGEQPPPIVDMGELGPVRCGRCKAYMCPFMQFVDGGRRFQCPFCKATSEVPPEYFQHLDHTGMRVDKYQRAELCLGSYEFVGTKEYCRNVTFPKPPAYVFAIDVSYNNIKSGLVSLLCQNMKSILKRLPREVPSNQPGAKPVSVRVGFITYTKEIHFYNIKPTLAQPQMMVVSDVGDMFVPLLDGFLCDPDESEALIDQLMLQIPAMFGETRETETVLGPAIKAGFEALKEAQCAGKLLVFHSSLPIADAPGKLKSRDDRKLLGTDKEKTILRPDNDFYNQLGQECSGIGCRVDLFVANNAFVDLATIGQVSRLSGGQIYKYTYFQADLDGERLVEDLRRNVEQTVGFDTVLRVRTSTGVRPVDFFGHFFMSNTTDVETAGFDSDQAITVEIKHDDKLTDEDGVYIQVAVLFTSPGGQRRLRIHNLSLNVCSQMADLYRTCDLDTIMNLLLKQSVCRLLESTPKQVKDALIQRSAQILATYRKNCASPTSSGQLILPECMKLLPLYANCLLNCDAVSGGQDIAIDDRRYNMYSVMTMHVAASLAYLYPRLVPLLDPSQEQGDDLKPVRCTVAKLRDDGVYVLDNGVYMFMWIGLTVNPEWIHNVFGSNSAAQIDIDRTRLVELDNPDSQKVRAAIARLRATRQKFMKLILVRPRDKLEYVFRRFLAEDKPNDTSGGLCYVDFLCHLHKEIRALMN